MSFVPQVGFFEIILLAALALMIVGPKDLPRLMYGIGKFFKQIREMAGEFRAGFDQMAREIEMDEMRQEIESLKKNNPMKEVEEAAKGATQPLEDSSQKERNSE